ncbi:DUF1836 domain-containing protein [Solibaculum mannosilyticum]|uniref:DUF1836 domain-containing protein n=1 Tax=Solibaculum mannosilyticum TaxID=2780922 RepID=UPI0034B89001
MESRLPDLTQWMGQMEHNHLARWDELPDLELYMDQVITYLDRQLTAFKQKEEKGITSSMINNYVKDGLVPRPKGKKYQKRHLADLLTVCTLKPVLPISDIALLLEQVPEEQRPTFHNDLCEMLDHCFSQLSGWMGESLQEEEEEDSDHLMHLALQLSVEAATRRVAAQRIFADLKEQKKKRKEETGKR